MTNLLSSVLPIRLRALNRPNTPLFAGASPDLIAISVGPLLNSFLT